MGIQPPSDLIIDVINAADPAKAQAMATRLRQASATTSSLATSNAATAFDSEMRQVGLPVEMMSVLGKQTSLDLRNSTALSQKSATGNAKTMQQFEAMVLSTFVQSMLPTNATNVYGSGTAGDVWKSMLSQHIAGEMAKGGGIGIAQRVSSSVARTSAAMIENLPQAPVTQDTKTATTTAKATS
ncbi:MAG: hypothetical protein B7X99_00430 [Rhizobiales bacterium 17-65-6]|nr:MAG: hypothetical protein B7Z30_18135 [Rhizobiales bacterium 12-68-15]OYX90138.1 MAG: hypothetical protein B7Y84_02430 [Azorhizobium sp. 32-67-21]OZA01484.1 MAG: hypothetical protein B7X99_00430 [Rhizobiales bacterium 17-65-6]